MSKYNAILLMIVCLLSIILFGCGRASYKYVNKVSCTIEESTLMCLDGTEYTLPVNGVDGEKGDKGDNGRDGTDGTQVEVIFPCEEASISHEEIILKIDNQFIAYFQNIVKQGGANSPIKEVEARLTVLEENTLYMLTDGSQCKFRIVDGNIIAE